MRLGGELEHLRDAVFPVKAGIQNGQVGIPAKTMRG